MQTFQKYSNLESVSFQEPSDITSIEKQLFSYCINLKTIKLYSQIRRFAYHSFEGCKKLESLIILSNISEIKMFKFKVFFIFWLEESNESQKTFQGWATVKTM